MLRGGSKESRRPLAPHVYPSLLPPVLFLKNLAARICILRLYHLHIFCFISCCFLVKLIYLSWIGERLQAVSFFHQEMHVTSGRRARRSTRHDHLWFLNCKFSLCQQKVPIDFIDFGRAQAWYCMDSSYFACSVGNDQNVPNQLVAL